VVQRQPGSSGKSERTCVCKNCCFATEEKLDCERTLSSVRSKTHQCKVPGMRSHIEIEINKAKELSMILYTASLYLKDLELCYAPNTERRNAANNVKREVARMHRYIAKRIEASR
jgi:hypothetical protein